MKGLMVVMLVLDDFVGVLDVLNGRYGFLKGYLDVVDLVKVVVDLGGVWEIMCIGVKFYLVCCYMYVVVDGLLELCWIEGIGVVDILCIVVGLYCNGIVLVGVFLFVKCCVCSIVEGQFFMFFVVVVVL